MKIYGAYSHRQNSDSSNCTNRENTLNLLMAKYFPESLKRTCHENLDKIGSLVCTYSCTK